MPMKRENYSDDWEQVSLDARIRAGNKCENCGAPNGLHVWRSGPTDWALSYLDDGKFVKIVLTVAHLNHDTHDNRPENLRAWCQRCHLRYDREHHAESRAANKERRIADSGQARLL